MAKSPSKKKKNSLELESSASDVGQSVSADEVPSEESAIAVRASELSPVVFWGILAAITLLSAVLRFYHLPLRPFHNDEGVNWYFIDGMKGTGYYPYSHENYHGPSYFYITRLFVALFGDSATAFRASAAVVGVLTPLLLLILRRIEGEIFVLFGAALLSISASLVFYSRYAIHETLFLFGGTFLALSSYAWLRTFNRRYLIFIGIALGLLISTKETFIIWLFSVGLAVLATGDERSNSFWRAFCRSWVGLGAFLAAAITLVCFKKTIFEESEFARNFRSLIPEINDHLFVKTVVTLGICALLIGLPAQWRVIKEVIKARITITYGALLMALIVFAFYSGGFQWSSGIRELCMAVQQWMGRNQSDTGHHKPFGYYTKIILGSGESAPITTDTSESGFFSWIWNFSWPDLVSSLDSTEPLLILTLLIPVVVVPTVMLVNRWRIFIADNSEATVSIFPNASWPFYRFLSIWTLSAYFVYSFIKYKTPWLIINITLPASLLLAWWFRQFCFVPLLGKVVGWGGLALVMAAHAVCTNEFNFDKQCEKKNKFCYVHTTQGMIDLVEAIKRTWDKNPDAKVLVAVNGYWPLPFYLRGGTPEHPHQVAYVQSNDFDAYAAQYDILIMEKEVQRTDPHWARKYYRLSDVEETEVYFKRAK